MRKLQLTILALPLSLALIGNAASTEPAVLSGRVTDPSGAVIPAAVIELRDSADGRAAGTRSARDGKFRAGNVAPGAYRLTVEAPGFAVYRLEELKLGAGETRNIDIVLRLQLVTETVTVTAKAPAGEFEVETSSRNTHEILEMREARESSAKDVGEAIANLEGLWKIRKAGIANDVVLRGFQQGNVDVLVDGTRIYGACPGHMDPPASHVDFAEIQTVEVTKGPFDIRNQGSLGGSVNIVSKRPDYGFQLTPNLAAGSFGFANPSIVGSFAHGRFFGLAGYSYRGSDPYRDGSGKSFTSYANYNAGAISGKRAFDVRTAWARFGMQLAPNQVFEVAYTRQSAGLTLYPALTMDAGYDNADRLSATWTLGELPGTVKYVRAEAYYSRVKHWMSDELRVTAAGTALGFGMGTFAGSKAAGGRIEAELSDTVMGLELYDRGWSVVANMVMGGKYMAQASLPDVRMLVGGAYAQRRSRFGRLTITYAGRVDTANSAALSGSLDSNLYWLYHGTRSTSTFDAAPSGNIRLGYLLPGGIEAFAGAGSSVRLPDPQERYYAVRRTGTDWVGNPSLPPSRNNEVDLGINIRSRWFTLRPTIFLSRLSDLVVVTQRSGLASAIVYSNGLARSYEAVDARMYGGEVSYSVGFGRALLISGGASYVRGIHFAQEAAGLPRSDLAETPPLKARASLRYGRRLFFGEVNAAASAPQNRVDTLLLESRTPGYALLGCDVGIHHSRFSMSVGIDNLLNRYYREHLSFQRDPFRSGVRIPEPGRSVHINISADLRNR